MKLGQTVHKLRSSQIHTYLRVHITGRLLGKRVDSTLLSVNTHRIRRYNLDKITGKILKIMTFDTTSDTTYTSVGMMTDSGAIHRNSCSEVYESKETTDNSEVCDLPIVTLLTTVLPCRMYSMSTMIGAE